MALIVCPECNKQVSDKAVSCPNCGYPIQNNLSFNHSGVMYNVVVTKIKRAYIPGISLKITSATGLNDREVSSSFYVDYQNSDFTVRRCPFVAFTTRDKKVAQSIVDIIKRYYGDASVEEEANSDSVSSCLDKALEAKNSGVVFCPVCGSTSITTGQRGYSLLTGFLGSSKTVNRCANCGHTWTPGKR